MRQEQVAQPGAGPTRAIEEWWQDELDLRLVDRIASASHTQIHEFTDFYDDHALFKLPPRPSGLLRPRVVDVAPNGIQKPRDIGLSLLLYAHEVVVDDPLRRVLVDSDRLDRAALRSALLRILELRPLDLAGVVHFEQSTWKFLSKVRHPSRSQDLFLFEDAPSIYEVIQEWRMGDRLASIPEDELVDYLEFGNEMRPVESAAWLVMHVLSGAKSIDPNLWNPFARNLLESQLLDAALRDMGAPRADKRGRSLTKLSAIDVPDLGLSVPELVKVRLSSEAFEEWRTVLRAALDQVEMLPGDSDEWKAEAREVVSGELRPFADKLETSTARSPFLSGAQAGWRNFLLTGLGTVAGGVIGGGVMGAAIGAGTAVAAEATSGYLNALRQQRADKAVLQLALTFSAESAP